MDCRRARWIASAALALGCSTEPSSGDDTTGDTIASGESSSSTGDTTTPVTSAATTVDPSATGVSITTSAESSSGEPEPLGPPCSVQEVTEGALFDPLPRGDGAGVFPTAIADLVEDSCGCHTLMSDGQNLAWPELKAPGGTLFLSYGDLSRPYESGTLGMAMQAQYGHGMPPGSCGFHLDQAAALTDWFAQGMPDGATYVP